MKKIIWITVVVLAVMMVAACQAPQEKITFSGTIIQLDGDNALVEPFQGEAIRGSADKISINLDVSEETFALGDEIIVEYDGTVMESYPAQVNVLGIEKIN